jgi:bifunctional DNA-binding transcriptional regulator/antitoxin component of YhaV-PrlF toxin-antitoxin module
VTTTVTETNQSIIPPDIAREFNIHPGTQLEWIKAGAGSIQVKPLPSRGELARQLMGSGKDRLKLGIDPIAELIRERVEDDNFDRADEH